MLQYEELRLRLINHEKTLDDLSEALGLDKMKEEMQERAEKKIKKLRKILTDEQYDLWLTMKPEQPVPHPMPEAGRPAPHEEDFPVEMLQNETEHE